MRNRLPFSLGVGCLVAAAIAVVACGGDDSGVGPGPGPGNDAGQDATKPASDAGHDASPGVDAGQDAGDAGPKTEDAGDASTSDAPNDAPNDAPSDAPATNDAGDGGDAGPILPPATPRSLAKGDALFAVTSDGWLFYGDSKAPSESAVSLQGGNPVSITPAGATPAGTWAVGPVAFVSYAHLKNQPLSLIVWTHAGGAHTLPSWDGQSHPLVSNDGTRLLYVAPGATAGTFDYIEAGIDLSNPVTLATSRNQYPAAVAGDSFVVQSTHALADGGTTASVDGFDLAGKKTHLGDDVWFTATPTSDTVLLVSKAPGVFTISASKGGTPVQIATNTTYGEPTISPNGKYAAFINLDNVDHSIWSFTMASPKPAALPKTNGEYVSFVSFSPDGSCFTVSNGPDSLALVSTTAGNQTEIDRTGYSSVSNFTWFTNDSRSMVVAVTPNDAGSIPELALVPVDTLKIAPIANSTGYVFRPEMAGPSKVVFMTPASGLLVADVAKPDAPASIAKDAQDPNTLPAFLLNAAGDGVVYQNSTGLLYVAIP
jgi:hypothetical protein